MRGGTTKIIMYKCKGRERERERKERERENEIYIARERERKTDNEIQKFIHRCFGKKSPPPPPLPLTLCKHAHTRVVSRLHLLNLLRVSHRRLALLCGHLFGVNQFGGRELRAKLRECAGEGDKRMRVSVNVRGEREREREREREKKEK